MLRWLVAVILLLPLAGCTGHSGGETEPITPIALPTFTSCHTNFASRATNVVIPVRVIRPKVGSAIIVAGVCLEGQGPFSFIVDTGASITAIDPILAARLRLHSLYSNRTNSFGCTRTLAFAEASGMSVDGLSLDSQVVGIGDLRSPRIPDSWAC